MFNKFTTAGISHPAQGSAEFNGTSDFIQLDNAFSHTNHTIAAWVYLNDDSTNKAIFDNRDANDDGIVLVFLSSEELRYDINASGSSYSNMPINEWTFITATYDGTSQKIFAKHATAKRH